jgi:predicted tellurium resistance membrane protein TerC
MNAISSLFDKQMSRKEFLQTIGILILSIVGLGMLIKSSDAIKQMGNAAPAPALAKPTRTDTYGS